MSTIGGIIDELHDLRESKRALERQIKIIEGQVETLEQQLISQMDAEGVAKATGTKASVAITPVTRPTVEDWDEFYDYIHKNKYYHLLERRPSVSGCQELFELKGRIPGVVPFTRRKPSLRSL